MSTCLEKKQTDRNSGDIGSPDLICCRRTRRHEALISRLSRTYSFFAKIESPVVLLDSRLRVCALNRSLQSLLEISQPQDTTRAVRAWVHNKSIPEMSDQARLALNGGSSVSRFWGRLPSSKVQRYTVTYMPLFEDSDQPVAIAMLFTELSEVAGLLGEEALANNCYELGHGEWIWEMDAEHRFTYMTPNAQFFTQEHESFFIGKTRKEILLEYNKVERLSDISNVDFDLDGFYAVEHCMEHRKPFYNYVYSRPWEGGSRWQSISGIPVYSKDAEKKFLGYRGVAKDITHLSVQFAKYKAISNALNLLSVGMATFDSNFVLENFNEAFPRNLSVDDHVIRVGMTFREIVMQSLKSSLANVELSILDDQVVSLMGGCTSESTSFQWKDQKGKWFCIESRCISTGGFLVEIRDITNQKRIESQLSSERNILESLIESMPDSVFAIDKDRRYIAANSSTTKWLGLDSTADLIGNSLENCFCNVSSTELKLIADEEKQVIEQGKMLLNAEKRIVFDGKTRILSVSKVPIRNAENEVIGLVGHAKDVSYLHELSDKLAHQAEHDMLTGLVNRWGFDKRLEAAVAECRSMDSESVVCFLDLDRFKIVNDTVGHHAGDELLRQVSQMIRQTVRQSDVVARLGGDEFGIILIGCSIDNALMQMNLLIERFSTFRFQWEDKLFDIGVSIGIVELHDTDQSAEALMSNADIACYAAKAEGRGGCHVYNEGDAISTNRQNELQLGADIRTAIDEDGFELYKQPIAVTSSSELDVHHYEILLRMQGSDGRMIPPNVFIPAAERFGLMPVVDRWVINSALGSYDTAFVKKDCVVMTINLSGQSLTDPGLGLYVREKFKEYAVDPACVCFEITETAYVSNLSQAQSFIEDISSLGCTFALDDFGSGLSSFAYLKNFDINYLKIDGCFVRNIVTDSTDRAMVAAINVVGHTLGILTIAEFVETDAHIEVLRDIGVDYVQGYGIEKPTPLLEFCETAVEHAVG